MTAPDKIEFSYLNGNLMVSKIRRITLPVKETRRPISRALDNKARRDRAKCARQENKDE
jgi:hypothetical protein